MRRGIAHQELTTKENLKVLGTWTPGTWRGFAVEACAAEFYKLRAASLPGELKPWHPQRPWNARDVGLEHLLELDSPLRDVIEEGRVTSGAMMGEHRRDLKEALIGGKPQSIALVGAGADNGGAEAPREAAPARKRGI